VATSALRADLRQAVDSGDPNAIRSRLESSSALRLVGQELDHAAHNLWALEARPAALQELRRAAQGHSVESLQAAIEAAAVAGVQDQELDAAKAALQALEISYWRWSPADGNHIDIRAEPRIDGKRTRNKLNAGEVFKVTEERKSPEGVLYLKLADGRGWVFDMKPGVGPLATRHEEEGPGVYTVIHDRTAVTRSVALGSDDDVVGKLGFGAVIRVIEVVRSHQERRVRGRIENPPGWISIMNMETGKRWAQKQTSM